MEEYGVAIAQTGTPVARASDYQRILDSRWKTVSLVVTAPLNIPDLFAMPDEITKIVDHNLGYLPAFEAPFFNTRYEVQSTFFGAYLFVADRKSIYLINQVAGNTFQSAENARSIIGAINVYDINMEEDYSSMPKGVPSGSVESHHGIKIIGNDQYAAKNVQDSAALGFATTTDAKAMGIYKVDSVTVPTPPQFGTATATVDHELGYPPLIKFADMNPLFGSIYQSYTAPSNSDAFIGALSLGNLGLRVRAKPNQITVESSVGKEYRYVLFREPTEVAT
jgi:hypothetical protein